MAGQTLMSWTVLGVLGLSLLFHVISFGAPYWYGAPNGHTGLWRWCTFDPSVCYGDLSTHSVWEKATAALMTLALLCVICGTAGALLYNCSEKYASRGYMRYTLYGSFGATFFSLISLIIWGAKVADMGAEVGLDFPLEWGYVLAVLHCIMGAIGGGLSLFIIAKASLESPHQDSPVQNTPDQCQDDQHCQASLQIKMVSTSH